MMDDDDILSVICRPTREPDPPAKVLGILQNSWFKNPERVQRIFDRHNGDRDRNARFHADMLFFGCLTGKRILTEFGEAADWIVWENASPKIAGKSNGVFPPDLNHILATIRHFEPVVVLTFGKVAADGVMKTLPLFSPNDKPLAFNILSGPHPAARHATVTNELRDMAQRLREICPEMFR